MNENPLLKRAYEVWAAASDFRTRRERNKRFTYGDQWADPSVSSRGTLRTEGEDMIAHGRSPLTNNMIRQLVKTIVGRYRTLASESRLYSDQISRRNALGELDSRMLEEFLISGSAVQRIACERRFPGDELWIDNVDPRRFFVNAFSDPRGWDIELVGMLHDMSEPELISRYGHGDKARAERLRALFASLAGDAAFGSEGSIGLASGGGEDFFTSGIPSKLRIIEVWSLDAAPNEASAYDFAWRCRVFAPDGTLVDSYASPFRHGSHPFVVKFYPLTDGELHSFVEDLIEGQKYINRLVTQIDHIMASSAKGALLFPMKQKPAMVSMKEIAEKWARPDSLIPITGEGELLPQQIASSGTADGAYRLLELQMKLFENNSGVSDVLLGRNVSAAVGTENYRARVEAATIALADIFETFGSFREARDSKVLES